MLSSVARLRLLPTALIIALVAHFTYARDEVLFTSSVSYCAPPELVLVQQFDVTYFASNQSVFFNISAASVQANVNVTANLLLNVYGMQPVNLTLDLCGSDILGGALCPLPTYNFTGSTILSLPQSVAPDVKSRLPGIAFKIPDLEAFAQLTLTRIDTGELKACVQSTLSNGWSTRQTAVQWSTGGIALLSFLSALFHTLYSSPEALAPFRLVSLLGFFQFAASSALLNLNYPVVYRSFASNFSWALGFFTSSARSRVQAAINDLRHKTGGTMPDANGGSAIDLVNRMLSPYNAGPDGVNAQALTKLYDMWNSGSGGPSSYRSLMRRDVATVTSSSDNVLQAGIPVFVNMLGISTANAFLSVFFTLLILTAIAMGVLALGWGALALVMRRHRRKGALPGKLDEFNDHYGWFAKAWALRLALICFTPITIFAFAQWTLKDSWLSILLSVISLLAVLAALLVPTYLTFRLARAERPWTLYRHTPQILSNGPLYIQHRHIRWWFFLVPLLAVFIRALVIALGKKSGLAQVVVLLILEIGVLGSTVVFKPHETRGGDVLATTLAIVRVVVTGMSFAFVEKFNVKAIPRVAVGIVIAVIVSVAVILLFINTLVNLGLRDLWREKVRGRFGTKIGSSLKLGGRSPKTSFSDKDSNSALGKEKNSMSSSQPTLTLANAATDRPRNPTPLQHIPLDPSILRPYPEITPTQTSSSLSPPNSAPFTPASYASSSFNSVPSPRTIDSGFTSGSGSTTLGSILPRRPSFEGLGLPPPTDMDLEGGTVSRTGSEAHTHYSTAPSTPLSYVSNSRRSSYRESWIPSSSALGHTLPTTPEGVEALPTLGHEREGTAA